MPSDGVVREGELGLISLVHVPKLEGAQENGWLELDAELPGELGIVLTPEKLQIIFIDHQPQMAFGVQSIDRQIHDPNGVSFYALNGVQTMHLTQVSDATAALVPASPPYGGGRRRRAVRRSPVSVLNLKLIKSSLVAASIAFVFGYALGAANWLKTRPSLEERTTKIEWTELAPSVSSNSQDVEALTTSGTSPPPVPAAAAPDSPALEEPSTSQTASTPPPVPPTAPPIAVAAPEAMPLENGSSGPPLPRADPRAVAQKLVGTGLPSDSFRRSSREQLAGSRAPHRWPNPFRDF
jgi:hypothetical protein